MVECVKGRREQIMGKAKVVSCNTGGQKGLLKERPGIIGEISE